jgi:hypothetical protein
LIDPDGEVGKRTPFEREDSGRKAVNIHFPTGIKNGQSRAEAVLAQLQRASASVKDMVAM